MKNNINILITLDCYFYYQSDYHSELKAIGRTREKTWCLSTVNFDWRDSEKPCAKGEISFVGVGDSCTKQDGYQNNKNQHDVMQLMFYRRTHRDDILQIQDSGQFGEEQVRQSISVPLRNNSFTQIVHSYKQINTTHYINRKAQIKLMYVRTENSKQNIQHWTK